MSLDRRVARVLASSIGLAVCVGLAREAAAGDSAAEQAAISATAPRSPGERFYDAGKVAYDLALLRPVSAVRTVVGSVAFLPMALFALPGGRENIHQAYEVLIGCPFELTFQRPLGKF
jgi:hypothetical protein